LRPNFLLNTHQSEIVVQTARNDWYHAPDFQALLQKLAQLRAGLGDRPVVSYGISMGGYAAMLTSGTLRPDWLVLVAPQISVDPLTVPFEHRWRADRENIEFTNHDLNRLANHSAKGVLIYDPLIKADADHAAMARQHFPGLQPAPMPLGGHLPPQIVRMTGNFADFYRVAIIERGRPADLLAQFRQRRRLAAAYWVRLAELAARRRQDSRNEGIARQRHSLACRALEMARDLDLDGLPPNLRAVYDTLGGQARRHTSAPIANA